MVHALNSTSRFWIKSIHQLKQQEKQNQPTNQGHGSDLQTAELAKPRKSRAGGESRARTQTSLPALKGKKENSPLLQPNRMWIKELMSSHASHHIPM